MSSPINRFSLPTALAALCLSLFWLQGAPYPVAAQTPEPQPATRSVTVAGSGQVNTQPDVAVVVIGVQTEDATAGAALTQNNQQMTAVIDTLTAAGIAAEDIQTQAVQLLTNPPLDGPPQPLSPALPQATRPLTSTTAITSTGAMTPTTPLTATGYIAINLVEVRVRDLANLGSVLDSAIQAGGNQIQSIRFEVSDPATALDQAREAAWADARRKAEQLAELAGAALGEVVTINDYTVAPYPAAQASLAGRGGGPGVPVEPGSQTVVVNLQVTWRLQ